MHDPEITQTKMSRHRHRLTTCPITQSINPSHIKSKNLIRISKRLSSLTRSIQFDSIRFDSIPLCVLSLSACLPACPQDTKYQGTFLTATLATSLCIQVWDQRRRQRWKGEEVAPFFYFPVPSWLWTRDWRTACIFCLDSGFREWWYSTLWWVMGGKRGREGRVWAAILFGCPIGDDWKMRRAVS